jgi:hypothetical protein
MKEAINLTGRVNSAEPLHHVEWSNYELFFLNSRTWRFRI